MERHFEQEMDELKKVLLEMSNLSEQSINRAVAALENLDAEAARGVIDADRKVDQMELKIDDLTFDLTARHQPMARDLRLLMMVPRISVELERIADYAVNIAQKTIELHGKSHIKPLVDIPRLSRLAREMVKKSIESFIALDSSLAKDVCRQDDEADLLRDMVYKDLVDMVNQDGRLANQAIALIMVAQYLERICDHATNIAEDVVFLVEAKLIKHCEP